MIQSEINGTLIRAPLDTSPGWERKALPGQPDNTYAALTVSGTESGALLVTTPIYRKYLVVEAYSAELFQMTVSLRSAADWEAQTPVVAALVGASAYRAHFETEDDLGDGCRVEVTGSAATAQTVEVGVGTTRMEVA